MLVLLGEMAWFGLKQFYSFVVWIVGGDEADRIAQLEVELRELRTRVEETELKDESDEYVVVIKSDG